MRRLLVGLIFAFFTFTVGVGVSLGWMIVKWPLIPVEDIVKHTLSE